MNYGNPSSFFFIFAFLWLIIRILITFQKNQIEYCLHSTHLNGFSPVCCLICISSIAFLDDWWLQTWQMYGFNLLWTAWTCFFRHFESAKYFWHNSHCFLEYHTGTLSLFLSICVTVWFFNCANCAKFFIQIEHANFFSFEWIWLWTSNWFAVDVLKLGHKSQENKSRLNLWTFQICSEHLRHLSKTLEQVWHLNLLTSSLCCCTWQDLWISTFSWLEKVKLQLFSPHLKSNFKDGRDDLDKSTEFGRINCWTFGTWGFLKNSVSIFYKKNVTRSFSDFCQ